MKKSIKLSTAALVAFTSIPLYHSPIYALQNADEINYVLSTNDWTNQSVNIHFTLKEDALNSGYQFDEGEGVTLNEDGSALITATTNATYTIKASNHENTIVQDVVITNIDQVNPSVGHVQLYKENDKVYVKVAGATDNNEIKEYKLYSLTNNNVISQSTPLFENVSDDTYYIEVVDSAGNISRSENFIVASTLDISLLNFTCSQIDEVSASKTLSFTWNEGSKPATFEQLIYKVEKDGSELHQFELSSNEFTISEGGNYKLIVSDALNTQSIDLYVPDELFDKQAPQIKDLQINVDDENIQLEEGIAYFESEIVLSGTADDDLSGVKSITVFCNGQAISDALPYTITQSGAYTVVVEDYVGRTTEYTLSDILKKECSEIIIDSERPSIIIQDFPGTMVNKEDIPYYKDVSELIIDVKGTHLRSVTITNDKNEVLYKGKERHIELPLSLNDGMHTLSVVAKTKTGVTSSKEITFGIDSVAPEVNTVHFKDNNVSFNIIDDVSYFSDAFDIEVGANDVVGIKEYVLYNKDKEIYRNTSGTFTINHNGNFYVEVIDQLGNKTEKLSLGEMLSLPSNDIVIDKEDGKIVFDLESNKTYSNHQQTNIQFQDNYGIKQAMVTINGEVAFKKENTKEINFHLDTSKLEFPEDGKYAVEITLVDYSNHTTTLNKTFNLDLCAPVIKEIQYNDQWTQKINFDIQATDYLISDGKENEYASLQYEYAFSENKSTNPDELEWTSLEATTLETSKNGYYFFRVIDSVGHISKEKEVVIDKIDLVGPEITNHHTELWHEGPTNTIGEAKITITATDNSNDKLQYSKDGIHFQDSNVLIYEITENGEYIFYVRDLANNVSSQSFTIDNIDTKIPVIDSITNDKGTYWTQSDIILIDYHDEHNENYNVEYHNRVTLEYCYSETKLDSHENVEWYEVKDDQLKVEENGFYYFRGTDIAGNISKIESIEINTIDKDAPVIETHNIELWNENATNTGGEVIVTVSATDKSALMYSSDNENYQSSNVLSYQINTNGTYQYFVKDEAGNVSEGTFVIDNIDTVQPIIDDITNDKGTEWSKSDVIQIESHDEYSTGYNEVYYGIKKVEYAYSTIELDSYDNLQWKEVKNNELSIKENGFYYFRVTDKAGNTSDAESIHITNIDHEPPSINNAKISLWHDGPTNKGGEVKVEINATDSTNKIYYSSDGENFSESNIVSFDVKVNGTYEYFLKDSLGNMTSSTFVVDNIDTELPIIDTVSEEVSNKWTSKQSISISYHDEISPLTNPEYQAIASKEYAYSTTDTEDLEWKTLDDDSLVVKRNGYYHFRVIDVAGNVSEVKEIQITNYDDTKPMIDDLNCYQSDKIYNGKYTNQDITIKVNASDFSDPLALLGENNISSIEYKKDDGEYKQLVLSDNGKGSKTAAVTISENGVYTFRCTDLTGNVSDEKSITISTIDKEGPVFVEENGHLVHIEKVKGDVYNTEYGTFSNGALRVKVKVKDYSGISNVQLIGTNHKREEITSIKTVDVSKTKTEAIYTFEIPLNKDGYVTGTYKLVAFDNVQETNPDYEDLTGNATEIKINSETTNMQDENGFICIESIAPVISNFNVYQQNSLYPLKDNNIISDATARFGLSISEGNAKDSAGLKNVKITVINNDGVEKKSYVVVDDYFTAASFNQLLREKTYSVVDQYNDGDIEVLIEATDQAGNKIEDTLKVKKDTLAPKVDVSYNNNQADSKFTNIYSSSRSAIVTITERNFNANLVNTVVTHDGKTSNIAIQWNRIGTSTTGEAIYQGSIPFTQEGDYEVSVSCKDKAGHQSNIFKDSFSIDLTAPEVNVSFDNNDSNNGHYYASGRTATITVKERYFTPERVTIKGIEDAKLSNWHSNGNTHTATIHFSKDGRYSFEVDVNDKVNHSSESYKSDEFVIDQIKPEISFNNVTNHGAYSGAITPSIIVEDINFDELKSEIIIKKDGAIIDAAINKTLTETGMIVTVNNMPIRSSNDGIYTITANMVDKAGNISTKEITYSVNRFGSTYLSEALDSFNGKYLKEVQNITVSEINVNELKETTIKVLKNGATVIQLEEGKDYHVGHTNVKGGWHQYTYTISKELFKEDGKYEIFITSTDLVGNVSQNQDEYRNYPLSFFIDKTSPIVQPLNIESNGIYNSSELTAKMSVTDNLNIQTLDILVNGKSIKFERNGDEISFKIKESNQLQNIQVVVKDNAGNETIYEIQNIMVTTNAFYRWVANKPLFYGSLVTTTSFIAAIYFFLFKKKKKNKKDE